MLRAKFEIVLRAYVAETRVLRSEFVSSESFTASDEFDCASSRTHVPEMVSIELDIGMIKISL